MSAAIIEPLVSANACSVDGVASPALSLQKSKSIKFFALENLSSHEVAQVCPRTMSPAADFPMDKAEYNLWKLRASTKHCFYSTCEGLTPSLRVTADNPPKLLHGFVCEFDADITEDMVAKIPVNGVGLLPTWVSRSRFRNGRRLVFEFKTPIFVDNAELAERFLRLFAKECKLRNLLPGLDDTCFKLTQYQELGIDWKQIPGSAPISSDLLMLLFFKAASAKPIQSNGPDIPIEKVAEEVERRWPGRWLGEFTVGARGPLFWIDDGIDRVGCQVGDFGIIAYSDRAGKSFLHWGEILGRDFVRNYEAGQIGAATEGVYFDSKSYWSKLANGRWATNKKEDLAEDLYVKYGLKPPQVKEALSMIRNNRRVTAVFPFIHNKSEVITDDAGVFLNITERKVRQPADHDGPYPWLKEYVNNIWDSDYPQQREIFRAWFKRLYQSAYEGNLKAGQTIIIAGPTDLGKTLFSRKVIGAALGGFTDASSYLLSRTEFNKECAETAVWCVDDNRGGATWEKHDEFSNALKRYTANPQIPYHPKYRDSTMVTWRGRIVVTCNLDQKSLSILPEIDDSNMDKIMLFQTTCEWRPKSFKDIEAVIDRELPFFLRDWLLNWEPPAELNGGDRFGVPSFHHPELLDATINAAPHGQLMEMLPYAIKHSYPNDAKLKEKWMNNTDIRALLDTDGLRSSLAKFSGNRLGIALSKLPDWLIKRNPETNRKSTKREGVPHYLVNLDESTYPK
jgi:hypothetical protein